jgi:hypothetical protein
MIRSSDVLPAVGGIDLDIPPREPIRDAPDFGA